MISMMFMIFLAFHKFQFCAGFVYGKTFDQVDSMRILTGFLLYRKT